MLSFINIFPFVGNEVRVIKVPPFAESITEGDIRWEKAVGDTVREDEVVGEIETDKVSIMSE